MKTKKKKHPDPAALEHIRDAAVHLAQCWDALGRAEAILGRDITVNQLSDLAQSIDNGVDTRADHLTDDVIVRWLRDIAATR